jgi:hypothetical protein
MEGGEFVSTSLVHRKYTMFEQIEYMHENTVKPTTFSSADPKRVLVMQGHC